MLLSCADSTWTIFVFLLWHTILKRHARETPRGDIYCCPALLAQNAFQVHEARDDPITAKIVINFRCI
jgi:hypothetical protein